jgi:hypothetical protein
MAASLEQQAGIRSIAALEAADPRRIEAACGRRAPFGTAIKADAARLPKLRVTAELLAGTAQVRVVATVSCKDRDASTSHLLVGNEANALLAHRRVICSGGSATVEVVVVATGKSVTAALVNERFIGVDAVARVNVPEAAVIEEIHPQPRQQPLSSPSVSVAPIEINDDGDDDSWLDKPPGYGIKMPPISLPPPTIATTIQPKVIHVTTPSKRPIAEPSQAAPAQKKQAFLPPTSTTRQQQRTTTAERITLAPTTTQPQQLPAASPLAAVAITAGSQYAQTFDGLFD